MAWLRVLLVLLASTAHADDDDERVRAQLTHVEQVLRARGSASAVRMRSLDLLHAYIERGVFPRNRERAGRWPHFIDEEGRICAVGFLVEQVGGRVEAERINAMHEWDAVPDIVGIEVWSERLGLSVEELAMIQPKYGWRPPRDPAEERGREVIERGVAAKLRQLDVQACAERYSVRDGLTAFDVSVVVDRTGAVKPRVPPLAGSEEFRRCVEDRMVAVARDWLRTLVSNGMRLYAGRAWATLHIRPVDERPRGTYRVPPMR